MQFPQSRRNVNPGVLVQQPAWRQKNVGRSPNLDVRPMLNNGPVFGCELELGKETISVSIPARDHAADPKANDRTKVKAYKCVEHEAENCEPCGFGFIGEMMADQETWTENNGYRTAPSTITVTKSIPVAPIVVATSPAEPKEDLAELRRIRAEREAADEMAREFWEAEHARRAEQRRQAEAAQRANRPRSASRTSSYGWNAVTVFSKGES